MENIIQTIGNIAAVLGVIFCFVAGICRILGEYYIFNMEAEAVFISGTGLMVLGCLAKLHKLSH